MTDNETHWEKWADKKEVKEKDFTYESTEEGKEWFDDNMTEE